MKTRSGCERVGWYKLAWQAVVGATMVGAAVPAAVTAGGAYYMASLFYNLIYIYFSNIYSHVILYLRYFNKKKPQVPWVLQVLFNTA